MSEAHTYKIEGVGEDFIPTATDFSVVDRILSCNDHDGLNMARTLAREEAIFVGGSAGMAAWVALEVAKDCGPDDLVVVLLPDTGERYLTKVHNDEWMRDNHLGGILNTVESWWFKHNEPKAGGEPDRAIEATTQETTPTGTKVADHLPKPAFPD